MKYLKHILLSGLATLTLSCDNDDDNNNDDFNSNDFFDSTDAVAVKDIAQTGSWRITRFIDDGVNETDDFQMYTFTFNEDGSIVADNGMETFNGSWTIEYDDDDDDKSDDLELEISFSTSYDLDELDDDWYVIEYSSNRIQLAEDDDDLDDDDLDDDDDDDDFLTFERN